MFPVREKAHGKVTFLPEASHLKSCTADEFQEMRKDGNAVIILDVSPANARLRYNATASLIGCARTPNDPWSNLDRSTLKRAPTLSSI